MKPTKIYKTEVDEFSSYARDHILDKKSSEQLRKLYDEWQNIREEALETKKMCDTAKRNIKLSPEGQPSLLDENTLKSFELGEQLDNLLKKERDAFQALQTFLDGLPKAPYDRYRLRDNFRNCLEITGVPLGELEVDGGISRGGFSRWEKTIITSELPLSFLLIAADRFGVTLKELLYSDIAEKDAAENWAREFIENLKELTEREDVKWEKCEDALYDSLISNGGIDIGYDADLRGDRYLVSLFSYEDFHEDDTTMDDYKIIGNIYCADVPGGQDTVYLFTLEMPGGEDTFMEIYIRPSEQPVEPLYSTRNGDYGTNELLKEFSTVISNNARRTRVSQGAREVMDRVARLVNRPGAARIVKRGGNSDEG